MIIFITEITSSKIINMRNLKDKSKEPIKEEKNVMSTNILNLWFQMYLDWVAQSEILILKVSISASHIFNETLWVQIRLVRVQVSSTARLTEPQIVWMPFLLFVFVTKHLFYFSVVLFTFGDFDLFICWLVFRLIDLHSLKWEEG